VSLGEALRKARREGRTAVVPYVMVDRRRVAHLEATIIALKGAGAAALELGFPFSDPIADGPVLEAAAVQSLQHGTRWSDLLGACKLASSLLPTAVMTYANPVWRRGLSDALKELSAAGASGLIVPDLSLEESGPWRRVARRERVDLVLLAAPGVTRDRLVRIARASRGFLYLVGRYGTTGASVAGSSIDLAPLVATARDAAPSLPVLVGFGVRDRSSARRAMASGADGFVIGSALEERLERNPRPASITRWLSSVVPSRRSTG
jgi:tryptophan synthase alpha chain